MYYVFTQLPGWILPQFADRIPTPHFLEGKTISRSPASLPPFPQLPPVSKLPEHAMGSHQRAFSDHLLSRDSSWEVSDNSHLGLLLDEESVSNSHLETLGV